MASIIYCAYCGKPIIDGAKQYTITAKEEDSGYSNYVWVSCEACVSEQVDKCKELAEKLEYMVKYNG